ncbi:MAG: peptidoglycan-binding protein [Rhodospirillales bacterium]|nr:peptidoglycan-binding protein [Rhodospirillales bacterium]
MPFNTFSQTSDPFGRLLAEPKPEPEIMDFQNSFRIRDSVGMEGSNARRDVAKVESLLDRAGALDLAKTDGVTGFFGARTDEAVKKFQKDRGLKVDGLINPNGPTLRTLAANANKGEDRPALSKPIAPETPLPIHARRS